MDTAGVNFMKQITTNRIVLPNDPLINLTKEVLMLRHYLSRMPLDDRVMNSPPDCKLGFDLLLE